MPKLTNKQLRKILRRFPNQAIITINNNENINLAATSNELNQWQLNLQVAVLEESNNPLTNSK